MIRSIVVVVVVAACGSKARGPELGSANAPAHTEVPAVPSIPTPRFPEPPQQHAAWTPSRSGLDPEVPAAVARLFEQGVADPRGCDYREIEIDVAAGWQDATTRIKTHGWVLPGAAKYAIAWNGLVYPAPTIGASADVSSDVRAMLEAHRKARDEAKRDRPDLDFVLYPVADEGHYVQTLTLAPGKAMMLLRLGDVALAEAVWNAATEPGQAGYSLLAEDWLWAQFVRGVGAHLRGDIALAIESWRRLPDLAVAARNDLPSGVPYLADISGLLADEQRRALDPPQPIDLPEIAKLATAERVARLVDALDQVTLTGFSGQDPIIAALIAEGDAAVEPLLVAYETDERRTRSRVVDIKHGDGRFRHVIAVHEIAYTTLSSIIDTSFFQPTLPDDGNTSTLAARRVLGEQLRAYYTKWRGTSPLARQYQVLADDTLDEARWLVAALQITARDPATQQLAGESLRAKAPAVTSLFVRRLAGFADLRQRARMLEAFAAWDAPAAKPLLARTVRDAFAGWAAAEHRGMDPYLGEALAGLTTARIAGGDAAALGEYGAWIATTLPEQAQFAARRWFAPMMANPRLPEMKRAATTLFTSSPWVPLTSKRAGFYLLELLGSDMIHVPAFRDHAIAQLSNRAKLGTMKMKRGVVEIQTEAFQTGESIDANDPLAPRDGWTGTLRIADQYAASLVQGRSNAPVFRRYWPVAKRDRALTAIAAWLRTQ